MENRLSEQGTGQGIFSYILDYVNCFHVQKGCSLITALKLKLSSVTGRSSAVLHLRARSWAGRGACSQSTWSHFVFLCQRWNPGTLHVRKATLPLDDKPVLWKGLGNLLLALWLGISHSTSRDVSVLIGKNRQSQQGNCLMGMWRNKASEFHNGSWNADNVWCPSEIWSLLSGYPRGCGVTNLRTLLAFFFLDF